MIQQNTASAPCFIKLEIVANKVGMGKSTVLAWEATGRFPRAVRLSPTLRVWLEADIDRWIFEKHAKIAEAEAQQ